MTKGRLPNFFVIGAMKAGTESLHRYLASHPQIFMTTPREVCFFNEESSWKNGIEWYRRHFEGAGDHIAVGEVCPTYSAYPLRMRVPERIAEVVPDPRFIYLIREPMSRITSHYLHSLVTGRAHLSIDHEVVNDPRYLYMTKYGMQLSRYLDIFPRESILVIRSEELRHQRLMTLRAIFHFLGADDGWTSPDFDREFNRSVDRRTLGYRRLIRNQYRRNRALRLRSGLAFTIYASQLVLRRVRARDLIRTSGAMSEATKEFVKLELRPDIQRLRSFMPQDFDGWGIA